MSRPMCIWHYEMWIEYDRIKKLADARISCERLLWNTAAHRTEQPGHDTHPHSTFGVVSASFCGSGLGLNRLNFRLHFLQWIPAHKFEPVRSRLNRGHTSQFTLEYLFLSMSISTRFTNLSDTRSSKSSLNVMLPLIHSQHVAFWRLLRKTRRHSTKCYESIKSIISDFYDSSETI